jgi:hypothetical protein
MLLPHVVSRGAQKNFQDFTVRLRERGRFEPNERYFQHLIAKAILFRAMERMVRREGYTGYRANIVTYTLAWLSHATAQRVDLDLLWRQQAVPEDLAAAIQVIARHVYEAIIDSPGQANVTEWCKREACWERCRGLDIPVHLRGKWVSSKSSSDSQDQGIEAPTAEDEDLIARVAAVPAEVWFGISKWAKETNNLASWQRSIAYSIGQRVGAGRTPSRKQAAQGVKIIEEAERLGFKA